MKYILSIALILLSYSSLGASYVDGQLSNGKSCSFLVSTAYKGSESRLVQDLSLTLGRTGFVDIQANSIKGKVAVLRNIPLYDRGDGFNSPLQDSNRSFVDSSSTLKKAKVIYSKKSFEVEALELTIRKERSLTVYKCKRSIH